MFFTQIEFIVFFIGLLVVCYLFKNIYLKKTFLLAANIYFYAYCDYRFLALLLCTTATTFLIGNWLQRLHSVQYRKLLLLLGISINVLILAVFKYYNFFIESLNKILSLDQNSLTSLNLLAPLGISFYTFRFIGHLVDNFKASENTRPYKFIDFLIYGTFFPIIISGPISKSNTFIPQLAHLKISFAGIYKGFRLFVIGLFLKVFIADRIAQYVSFVYENNAVFNSASIWLACLAYSIQIYFDFAGYSNMAIGLASMLGVKVEENFNFPYLANSISDFWKRWHITLSVWIKDYIYIPLGGNRKGTLRKDINLVTTMTLCGLWHGAATTFLFWGFLHGILLVLNHSWKKVNPIHALKLKYVRCYTIASWCITFLSVTFCWVFFRAESFNQAFEIISKLISFAPEGIAWYQPFVIFILLATSLFHVLYIYQIRIISLPDSSKLTFMILLCLLWLTIVFYPKEFQPFVYEQF